MHWIFLTYTSGILCKLAHPTSSLTEGHNRKMRSRKFYDLLCTFPISAFSNLHIILPSLFSGCFVGFWYDSLDVDVGISRHWCSSWYFRPVPRSFQCARDRGSIWRRRAGRIFERFFAKKIAKPSRAKLQRRSYSYDRFAKRCSGISK